MTDRIDHAAEAVALLNLAAAAQHQGDPTHLIAAAQVHATLALVRQQQIANLAALEFRAPTGALLHEVPNPTPGSLVFESPTIWVLRPDIAADLGIEAVDHA